MSPPDSPLAGLALSPLPERLTQEELARHWRVSPRTLERWRVAGTGPAWVKLPGRVLYRREDVLTYEEVRTTGGDVAP